MTRIDPQHAPAAVEHAGARRAGDEELSGPEARRILEMRAQLLAQPLAEPAATGDVLDLLEFARAGETYAVEAALVGEVVPLDDPTPMPGVPPAVLGVVNYRGQIIPVVDPAQLLVGAAQETGGRSLGVVVAAGSARMALRADTVSGITTIEEREVRTRTELGDDRRDSVVRGLTPGVVAILDVQVLARDPRVEVDDEVE